MRAIVKLLKAAFPKIDKAVYWDDDFEPGEEWFDQIKTHIDGAQQLFLFWCNHSSMSQQIRREFMYAMAIEKRVVPVLLDDTALSGELAAIHAIDLRGCVLHDPTQHDFVVTLKPHFQFEALDVRLSLTSKFEPFLREDDSGPES